MKQIKVGLYGGAGYGAGELLRLLLVREDVSLSWVVSRSHAGHPLHKVHADLLGYSSLTFSGTMPEDELVDLLFLCAGHGESREFLQRTAIPAETKIIDLSTDFRHMENRMLSNRSFVYGLPELQRTSIAQADAVANPGCFATAIELAVLPLASNSLIHDDLHIYAITGSTGAGAKLSRTNHFAWREGNVSVYKPFVHQHLKEIGETINDLQPDSPGEIRFVPIRGNFTRGIHATVYTRTEESLESLRELYREHYQAHPFTILSDEPIDLKQVVNTNRCHLHLLRHGDLVMITSVIDNLLKGAAGQAMQNMNIMFGLPEERGLRLKAAAF